MKRDEVKQLIEQGVRELNDALAGGKSEKLKQFLDVMAKFPRYSFGNCILIAVQKPDAQIVQGYQAWKKLGRWVRKGEKASASSHRWSTETRRRSMPRAMTAPSAGSKSCMCMM